MLRYIEERKTFHIPQIYLANTCHVTHPILLIIHLHHAIAFDFCVWFAFKMIFRWTYFTSTGHTHIQRTPQWLFYVECNHWNGNVILMKVSLLTAYDCTGRCQIWHNDNFRGCQSMQLRHNDLYGPLARYVKLRVAHAPGMTGTFSPPPRISDSNMHRGTFVTHVPWCMPGSLTIGFHWSRWRG